MGRPLLDLLIETAEQCIETNSRAQVGLAARDGLTPSARHASVLARPLSAPRSSFRVRETRNGPGTVEATGTVTLPFWLRLQRRGNVLIAFTSSSGTADSLEEFGRFDFGVGADGLPERLFVGFAVAGGRTPGRAATVRFEKVVLERPGEPVLSFLRGDCNSDGDVNIADATCILDWLFGGDGAPGCDAATNTNGDDAANITDATYLLNHLFTGGPAPVAPFPECGPGTLPADEELGCASPPACQ